MSGYSKIVVGLDFSDCSANVVREAERLADAEAELILAHVATLPPGITSEAQVEVDGKVIGAEESLRERSRRRLHAYQEHLAGTSLRVSTRVVAGAPAEALVSLATSEGAEAIVVGTHGRRGWARAIGGSVASEVVSQATVPVVTVRSHHRPDCHSASCATCDSHVTSELRQLLVERDG